MQTGWRENYSHREARNIWLERGSSGHELNSRGDADKAGFHDLAAEIRNRLAPTLPVLLE
jgi:hypothetical protein